MNPEITTFQTFKVPYWSTYKKISNQEFKENIEKYKQISEEKLIIHFVKEDCCIHPKCKNICFIYTNPKVGCTSLIASLNFYFSDYLTTARFHNSNFLDICDIRNLTCNQIIDLCNISNKNTIIIDIYRPIFDMCLSYFFLYFRIYVEEKYYDDMDYIIDVFNKYFLYIYETINVDYYREVYNLNRTFDKFDFDKKHLFHRNNNAKYIKLRLIDSKNWPNILKCVFDNDFTIIEDNKTENKFFGQIYKEFKKIYKIPKNYYELIKNNEIFRFYYTEEEQANYLKKFEGNILDTEHISRLTNEELSRVYSPDPSKLTNLNKYLSQIEDENKPLFNSCICPDCNIKKFIYIYQNN